MSSSRSKRRTDPAQSPGEDNASGKRCARTHILQSAGLGAILGFWHGIHEYAYARRETPPLPDPLVNEVFIRELIEAAPDALLVVDSGGRIVLVNTQLEDLFGYSRDELAGKAIEILVPDRFRANHEGYRMDFSGSPRTRAMGAGRSLWGRKKDGVEFPVEISLSPVPAGGEHFVAAAVRDVTEARRNAGTLRAAERLVALATLAAGIAHEINNPLTTVMVSLDLALESVSLWRTTGASAPPAELVEALTDAKQAAKTVGEIVQSMRVLARGETGRLEPVDVNKLLDQSLILIANAVQSSARVVKEFGDLTPVLADPPQLSQVFLNVLVNAAQAFSQAHAARNEIRIATRMDGARVLIEIADNGTGIPEAIRERIFEPFFTTKDVGQGMGLGLSITRSIVKALGGEITFESAANRGTVFRVALPSTSFGTEAVTPAALPPAAPTAARASAPKPDQDLRPPNGARKRLRVLVIDDDIGVARTLARGLMKECDVDILTDGREAIDRLSTEHGYDVVLCDLMMPSVTGADVYREVKTKRPESADRFVFITGGAFTDAGRRFLETVDAPIVRKPFDLRAVRALIWSRASR
jgi:PAS domain S-box-containing protein